MHTFNDILWIEDFYSNSSSSMHACFAHACNTYRPSDTSYVYATKLQDLVAASDINRIRLQGRNRRCITVDMRQEEGRQIIKELANTVDVLVENFRPGVMEKWNLGPKVIK